MKIRWTLYLALLLLISGGLDILSTRHVSPDLQLEANPIVISMGRSWGSVFMIKGLSSATAIVIFFLGLQGLSRRSSRLQSREGMFEIYSFLLFKERVSLARLLICWPKDWKAGLACGGVFLGTTPVFAGILGTTGNMLQLVKSAVHLHLLYATFTLFAVIVNAYLIRFFLVKQMQTEQGN